MSLFQQSSPAHKASPDKTLYNRCSTEARHVFQSASPNVTMTLPSQRKGIFSPKFEVVSRDWSNRNPTSQSTSVKSSPKRPSPRKRQGTLRRANTTDRFIPSHQSNVGKLSKSDSLPPPGASPADHIEHESCKLYQTSVAEACGFGMQQQRILQFASAAPECTNPASSVHASAYRANTSIRPSAAQARAKRIPTTPDRVLDAPGVVDDFYLNLTDWSSNNVLSIALEDSVYVWNASTGDVALLNKFDSLVTSVRWSNDGYYLSVGKEDGTLDIWDIDSMTKLRTMAGHLGRIGSQGWHEHLVVSGSRSGQIFQHDVRVSNHLIREMKSHTAEVCGIEWRADGLHFASGGNDNIVNIWDARTDTPQFTKTAHTAAVKALSWCPNQTSLLATGGGSADQKIHFWNSTTGARLNTIDTGSQVSALGWGYANGIGREIYATHGFPHNGVSVYSYPTLQKTGAIVEAHDSRILKGCLSPDGQTLATLAGDENLKFWKLFDNMGQKEVEGDSWDKHKIMTIR